MNQIDFGRLVASLRKEHDDESEYPLIKRWSQKKLATEANLATGCDLFTEDIISNVELGKRRLDHRTLLALADALQLTSGERKEFFLAASGIDNNKITRQRKENEPEKVLSQIIARAKQVYLPAFIIDSLCEIVAVNAAVLELLGVDSAGLSLRDVINQPFGLNMLQFVFSDKAEKYYKKLMGRYWDDYTYQNMMMFRTFSLRYRSTRRFQKLFQTLKKYRLFIRYWRDVYFQEKDHFTDNEHIHLNSPKWGHLEYFSTSFTALTTYSDLHFCVYVPATHKTSTAFSQIIEQTSTDMFRVSNWPSNYSNQTCRQG